VLFIYWATLQGGNRRPAFQFIGRPGCRFIRVAGGTRVRNLVLVCHCGRDEFEGVGTDERAGDTLGFDLRHMAGDTLTAGIAVLVMGMLFQGRRVRTVW